MQLNIYHTYIVQTRSIIGTSARTEHIRKPYQDPS